MRIFYWAGIVVLAFAQPVDATRQKIDPKTFLFEDGRTTVADYVIAQLRQHSTCCGVDNIYVELRITPEGRVESVRAMTGRNDCYKQSIRDILQPTLWKVEDFRTSRPIYYEIRLSEECKGTPEDNKYKPIPAPAGAAPQPPKDKEEPPKEEQPKKEEAKPIALTPSIPGTTPPKGQPTAEPYETETVPAKQSTPPRTETRSTPQAPAPKRPTPPKPTEEEVSVPPISDQPARKGFQPGKEPPKEPQPPNPPAVLGKLPDSLSRLSVSVPKGYRSTGEKRPPAEHIGSYVNTAGPRYSEPDYINGPIAKALYLKQEYRKRGVCGLVHVLLEVAIDAQGNVRGYRILRANRPDAEIATPQVLAGMKYKPVPLPMVFYTEFKIDVDCDSDQRKVNLDSIPDFIVSPDGKLIRPATPPRP